MNLIYQLEYHQKVLQQQISTLITAGAECLVKDKNTLITHFYVDNLELLYPQPFFNRQTGQITALTWWCWLREVHFHNAMQQSHLLHAKRWQWHDERNLSITTDDYVLLICALDPPETDAPGNAVLQEWLEYKHNNPCLEEITKELRITFLDMARKAIA